MDLRPWLDFVISSPPLKEIKFSKTEFDGLIEPDVIPVGEDYENFAAYNQMASPIRRQRTIGASLNQTENLIRVVANELNDLRFVPALRGFSEARYPLRGREVRDFAEHTDPRQNADALTTTIVFDDALRADLSKAMFSITGVEIDRDLSGDGSAAHASAASFRPNTGDRPKRIVSTNEGFGTNQLVHLIGQTLVTPSGGAVLMEEPEAHLHPSGQFQLASFIAQRAVGNDNQFIITTHSERFLAALLYQIRQEVLAPADLIVHYFNLNEDGNSLHQRRGVTHGGIVEGSFKDFFPPSDVPIWEEFYRGLE